MNYTQEQIIEGNKLLAKFMGCQYLDKGNRYHTVNPNYHGNWNTLMPVVEKIERLFDVGDFVINAAGVSIVMEKDGIYYAYSESDSKIEATWLACIAFIKWYNKQKES